MSAEEVGEQGRFDLRFRASDWDVIVELKIHAGYGRGQLKRYLEALAPVEHAHLVAITRDVPAYGEPSRGVDPRWAGSVRWRSLRDGLRNLPVSDEQARRQWSLFLDVLEEEGSMGFTQPDPELFGMWSRYRTVTAHVDGFVEAVRYPILQALIEALGGDESSADFYRAKSGRPLLAHGAWAADMPIRVPRNGPIRLRAGVFGWNPPTRFSVAPHNGRQWLTHFTSLSPEGQQAVKSLQEHGFRTRDLHCFLPLDEDLLGRPDLEEGVVEWTAARFAEIVSSGLLEVTPPKTSKKEKLGGEQEFPADEQADDSAP